MITHNKSPHKIMTSRGNSWKPPISRTLGKKSDKKKRLFLEIAGRVKDLTTNLHTRCFLFTGNYLFAKPPSFF